MANTPNNIRQRELYKYFTPPALEASLADTTSCTRFNVPDSTLTAHVQLAAWRLDCQRAMVSLIDSQTQYFVAESTKTLDLGGSGKADHDGDLPWMDLACTALPKAGRLCEYTIAENPPPEGGPAYFEVVDLREDSRFNKLPFVCGEPGFKYYLGVPLRTKKGVNIGSLFVLDGRPRDPASPKQREVLAAIAQNCMSHLETLRQIQSKDRAIGMNICLAAFVDSDRANKKRKRSRPNAGLSGHHSKTQGSAVSANVPTASSRRTRSSSQSRTSGRMRHSSSSLSSDTEGASRTLQGDEDERSYTYSRAADLLKSSLALESGGGVIFLAPKPPLQLISANTHAGDRDAKVDKDGNTRHDSISSTMLHLGNEWISSTDSHERIRRHGHSPIADVVASCLCEGHPISSSPGPAYVPLLMSDITKLIKRHPRGKLFSLDGEDLVSSSSDADEQHLSTEFPARPTKGARPCEKEAALLAKHFPGARQLIFLPFWDSVSLQWYTCFAFNTCEVRYLQLPEFLHSVAFVNCITTEISRIATATADQQKSDFIGSISHELRSPLHGILASCEFLADTQRDPFQKSLIDTTDACARTLLDTLNMVLDYSKINRFEQSIKRPRNPRKDVALNATAGPVQGPAPLLAIYGDVDLAIITEEVVEGVASGQFFKDSMNSLDIASPAPSKENSSERGDTPSVLSNPVEIIIDVVAGDWTFVTQPGAFRRIVMNLFGNALKYTADGFIKIKLDTVTPHDGPITDNDTQGMTSVVLTISDSGCGMSKSFMRTQLFKPFSQESAMNPGTGLGLSLVKSIVGMLNGTIDVRSAQGVGTEIMVTIPMLRGSPRGSIASSTPQSSGSTAERVKDDSIAIVQALSQRKHVSIYRPRDLTQHPDHAERTHMLPSTILHYLTDWFNFRVDDFSRASPSDVVICVEESVERLLNDCPFLTHENSKSTVLVLCTNASSHASFKIFRRFRKAQVLWRPVGPHKLARALRACLEHESSPKTSNSSMKATMLEKVNPILSPVSEVADSFHILKLGRQDGEGEDLAVIKREGMLANEQSRGAQRLLDVTPRGTEFQGGSRSDQGQYPFPVAENAADGFAPPKFSYDSDPPQAQNDQRTGPSSIEPQTHDPIAKTKDASTANSNSQQTAHIDTRSESPLPPGRPPRLLLVDDNRINLRLLNSFVTKNKYKLVTLAEDGAQAVSAFKLMACANPPQPPDIIFMDISMPIMDGFEATRRIRQVETEVREALPPSATPAAALIIALTGLASERDQNEAFKSGFDLYLTKPVSMREVGRLLSNWEAHGGAATVGVPNGAVTGADATTQK